MAGFSFLNNGGFQRDDNFAVDENDPLAAYIRARNKTRKESIASSTSLLSLSRISLCDEPGSPPTKEKSVSNIDLVNYDEFKLPQAHNADHLKSKFDKYRSTTKAEERLSMERKKARLLLNRVKGNAFDNNKPSGSRTEVLRELFTSNVTPQSPPSFRDELKSLVMETPVAEEKVPASKTKRLSSASEGQINFPNRPRTMERLSLGDFRSGRDAIEMFEEDEKILRAESSAVSHDSNVSHFSGTDGPVVEGDRELSIGEFFLRRSDTINSLSGSPERNTGAVAVDSSNTAKTICISSEDYRRGTIDNIREMISAGLSGSALVDKLLDQVQRPITEGSVVGNVTPVKGNASMSILDLPESRKSTPLQKGDRRVVEKLNATTGDDNFPILSRNLKSWTGCGFPLNKSTPKVRRNLKERGWCPLKESRLLLENNSESHSSTLKASSMDLNQSKVNPHMRNRTEPNLSSHFPSISNHETINLSCTIKDDSGSRCPVNKKGSGRVTLNNSAPHSRSMQYDSRTHSRTLNKDFGPNSHADKNDFSTQSCNTSNSFGIHSRSLTNNPAHSGATTFNAAGNTRTSVSSPILAIVKELADLPPGTIDCSAIASILHEEYPEIFLDVPNTESYSQCKTMSLNSYSWVEVACEPLNALVHASNKTRLSIPIKSKDRWLRISVKGVKGSDKISIQGKDVVLPPGKQYRVQVTISCKAIMTGLLQFLLMAVDLENGETQDVSVRINLTACSGNTKLSLIPASIDFGNLPNSCCLDQMTTLTYSGDRDLKLHIYILSYLQRTNQADFILQPEVDVNGVITKNLERDDNGFFIKLFGGTESVVSFFVRFQPSENDLPRSGAKPLGAELVVDEITSEMSSVRLSSANLRGGVAFGKFLERQGGVPAFKTSKNVPLTRKIELKNVGAIPLKLSLYVASNINGTVVAKDEVFIVPPEVDIPIGREVAFDVTFTAASSDNYVERYLVMTVEPNGYTTLTELVGIIESKNKEAMPRSSASSVSSGISKFNENRPVKLSASQSSLSWCAVQLQRPSLQSFQIKVSASASVVGRLALARDTDAFKIINEKGEAISKIRKTFTPDVPAVINVRFKPDAIGLHQNELVFDFNGSSVSVSLTGFGGCPKLRIEDTLSDYRENKMIKLNHPPSESSSVYSALFRITNYGNVRGFALVQPFDSVVTMGQALRVFPQEVVIEPNSNVMINVTQKLNRLEFRDIMEGRDIRKLANLHVITGDEPSRLRLRQFVRSRDGEVSQLVKRLINQFPNEISLQPGHFSESKDFETVFLKSLSSVEVAVVLEKINGAAEETVDDLEASAASFQTLYDTVIENGSKQSSSRHTKSPNTSRDSCDQDPLITKVSNWLVGMNPHVK